MTTQIHHEFPWQKKSMQIIHTSKLTRLLTVVKNCATLHNFYDMNLQIPNEQITLLESESINKDWKCHHNYEV